MTFKVASARDLMTATGETCLPERAFDVLKAEPAIEWEWGKFPPAKPGDLPLMLDLRINASSTA